MTYATKASVAALLATVAGLVAGPAAGAAPARKAVPAAGPQAAKGAADQGAVAPGKPVTLRIYLTPKGGSDALAAAAAAVSDPSSPTHGRYLTPAQYEAAYRPTAESVVAVEAYARDGGLRVDGVEAHSRYITVTGTAAAVDATFGTGLHRFAAGGDSFDAPTHAATVTAAIAPRVLAVSGLSTRPRAMKPHATAPAAFVNGTPCSAYYGEKPASDQPPFQGRTLPYAPCGYVPAQLRSAYEGGTALNGSGVTVAITDAYASPTIESDANTYAARHGDQPFAAGQLTQSNPARFTQERLCDSLGWYGEETLDVEAVHGMAPGANVLYYGSPSCLDQDFGDTLARVVDDDKASVVSNSWGDLESNETPDGVAAYEQVFQQGVLQGISFLFSSGDNGDEVASSGVGQADYPTSDPYVTSVGGTSTGIGSTGALSFQTGWGTDKFTLASGAWTPAGFLYGAGGGFSSLFARPAYQQGTVPGNTTGRAVPDVAMDADPTTGMLVGETQKFPKGGNAYGEYRIGGTSLAAPLMAGMQALRNQRTGARGGLLNPTLYGAAKGTITDVSAPGPDAGNVRSDYANGVDPSGGMVYSVRTFDQDSSLGDGGAVTKGWDSITGIGVPSATYLTGG
ncbi:S53 family peptidase [Paraconexibacter antarcticus]|uniref:S53 family peptidase n=1 Tax=Paraconexibacter antarcticus TaxID=2949664 RepID=A0ABY5DYA7_9ACTN|nr:S53 family peptidase [Paraconexibacter antarcticus]UTI66656.1 S53 family peptidase [Paraconexibacter antarcticus]